jgi:hypothetical protein
VSIERLDHRAGRVAVNRWRRRGQAERGAVEASIADRLLLSLVMLLLDRLLKRRLDWLLDKLLNGLSLWLSR